MSLKDLLNQYEELVLKRNAFNYANYIIGWDSETEAPAGCFENRSKMIGVLAGEGFRLGTSEETQALIDALYEMVIKLKKENVI